jgi:catalase
MAVQALMKEFSEIYAWRSKVVHTGKLPNKTKKTPFTPDEVKDFIERAQDLCRQSIIKIIEDGEFPDWNSLILGGEEEQASS